MPRLALVCLLVLIGGCATHAQVRVNATEDIVIERLALIVPDMGSFEVQHDRLKQTGTSTALFGIIGYAVEAGYRDSLDTQKEQEILEFVEQLDCPGNLLAAMLAAFWRNSDITVDVLDSRSEIEASYDAIGVFEMEHCGFTLSHQDTDLLVPYITLEAKVESSGGQVIWDDRETVVGVKGQLFLDLLNEENLASEMLDGLLKDAGTRLAYNIIYQ